MTRRTGSFPLVVNARYRYTIEAWTDVCGSWVEEMRRRTAAGQTDLAGEIAEGAELIRRARERAHAVEPSSTSHSTGWPAPSTSRHQLDVLLERESKGRWREQRRDLTRLDRELTAVADRVQARFASWYELFPR